MSDKGSIKDLIDLLSSIHSRTEEIKSAEQNIATQKRKRENCFETLRSYLGLPIGATDDLTIRSAEARIGRFYMYEFNKQTKESALARD